MSEVPLNRSKGYGRPYVGQLWEHCSGDTPKVGNFDIAKISGSKGLVPLNPRLENNEEREEEDSDDYREHFEPELDHF